MLSTLVTRKICNFTSRLLIVLAAAVVSAQTTTSAGVRETVLYSFGGGDGAGPLTGVIADTSGAFYGAAVFGGYAQEGVVFKLTPGKSGYVESVIYSFTGGADGAKPTGIVADPNGVLYGTTSIGGTHENGTAFKLTPAKSGYTFDLIYSFRGGSDGSQPIGAPVLDQLGNIYGVTQLGGTRNEGIVFQFTPGESGYTENILYSFTGGADGNLPEAGLTIDRKGSLYGTTYYGGTADSGTVFRLTWNGQSYVEETLYSFQGGSDDGQQPFAAPTVDERTGDVFGTTQYGGSRRGGVVFKLTRSGSTYKENVLYAFDCSNYQAGCYPESQLLLRPDGSLYGTASLGGGGCNGIGCGSVYRLLSSGNGYSFQYIYNFGDPANGAEPEWTALIIRNEALYGTTRSGGSKINCGDGGPGGVPGCGVLFRLTR
ncbi:MAG: choice-of-anchor tandem repeat GloVer-containing protein [Terriglobales bacterium]